MSDLDNVSIIDLPQQGQKRKRRNKKKGSIGRRYKRCRSVHQSSSTVSSLTVASSPSQHPTHDEPLIVRLPLPSPFRMLSSPSSSPTMTSTSSTTSSSSPTPPSSSSFPTTPSTSPSTTPPCLCNGVCARRKLNEKGVEKELEGVRLPMFNYTNKEVVPIKKWNKAVKEEILRVKSLKNGRTNNWITGKRQGKSILYEFDHVSQLKYCGEKTTEKLVQADITQVCHLASLGQSDEEISNSIKEISEDTHLSVDIIREYHRQALEARHGADPGEVNHLIHSNPYQSRSMCDKDCQAWMEKKDMLKHWIRPVLGCNDEVITENKEAKIISSKRYKGRPVGDCPEAMPLDNSLFRDLRASLDIHVTLTSLLPKEDSRRFSKGTPKQIVDAVRRLWDPQDGGGVAPKANRIIQDVLGVQKSLRKVFDADGAVVLGVVDRNGHRRRDGVGRQYWPRKDTQFALSIEELGLHPDCQEAVTELHDSEWEKFQESRNSR